jgi:hypothetical protein
MRYIRSFALILLLLICNFFEVLQFSAFSILFSTPRTSRSFEHCALEMTGAAAGIYRKVGPLRENNASSKRYRAINARPANEECNIFPSLCPQTSLTLKLCREMNYWPTLPESNEHGAGDRPGKTVAGGGCLGVYLNSRVWEIKIGSRPLGMSSSCSVPRSMAAYILCPSCPHTSLSLKFRGEDEPATPLPGYLSFELEINLVVRQQQVSTCKGRARGRSSCRFDSPRTSFTYSVAATRVCYILIA